MPSFCIRFRLILFLIFYANRLCDSGRLQSDSEWTSVIHEKENEFRGRHGLEPLKLHGILMKDAQDWANTLSWNCKSEPSTPSQRNRSMGAHTSENIRMSDFPVYFTSAQYCPRRVQLSQAQIKFVEETAEYWYGEIKNYPFTSGGYKGDGKDNQFPKFAHFTCSMWKGSKYVGYGLQNNGRCTRVGDVNSTTFVLVARYFPGGNRFKGEGEDKYPFITNILPPKKG